MGDIMGDDFVAAEADLTLEDCVKKCEVECGTVILIYYMITIFRKLLGLQE